MNIYKALNKKTLVHHCNKINKSIQIIMECLWCKSTCGIPASLSPSRTLVSHCMCRQRANRLRASEFIAGNAEHMQALARMGIHLVTMSDGRVQLLHMSSQVTLLHLCTGTISFFVEKRAFHWDTGIRELMRGMTTPSQSNQELLVVKDKVGRPPRWAWGEQVHGMWYFSPLCFDTVGWVTGRASSL